MSTIYDFDEKNAFESIKTHYSDNGFDLSGTKTSDSYIEVIDGEFNDNYIEIVKDVFVGEDNTFIVVQFDDRWGTHIFYIIEMGTSEFKSKWSEQVWAKFRADFNDTICPECGQKMAHMVAGRTLSDIGRIEQFHCDGCHYTWVGYPSGKFIREGVLH